MRCVTDGELHHIAQWTSGAGGPWVDTSAGFGGHHGHADAHDAIAADVTDAAVPHGGVLLNGMT